jgi:hypothetical protein
MGAPYNILWTDYDVAYAESNYSADNERAIYKTLVLRLGAKDATSFVHSTEPAATFLPSVPYWYEQV